MGGFSRPVASLSCSLDYSRPALREQTRAAPVIICTRVFVPLFEGVCLRRVRLSVWRTTLDVADSKGCIVLSDFNSRSTFSLLSHMLVKSGLCSFGAESGQLESIC